MTIIFVLRLLLKENGKYPNHKICYLNCFKLVILNFTTETAVKYEHFISDVERKHTLKHIIYLKHKIHPKTVASEYLNGIKL